ncbi:MAG TPA: hypothetical protein VEP89_00355, partial [Draconibacterium sp.]|nr:hypothetical protein [Draconibacterium sp.]
MVTRRSFLLKSSLIFGGAGIAPKIFSNIVLQEGNNFPVVIATGKQGMSANEEAWQVLAGGGYSLDAVETGVRVQEADPCVIVG